MRIGKLVGALLLAMMASACGKEPAVSEPAASKPAVSTPGASEPAVSTTQSAKGAGDGGMPVYVTPYYNSKGTEVAVGAHRKELAEADGKTIVGIAEGMKKERETLRAEVMYVLAIRLYDLGQKDEAVYWFYAAQYRARLFGGILKDAKFGEAGFELNQAYGAFNQLAAEYINGYGFGDLTKLEKTLTTVIEEGKTVPKFAEIYPKVAFVEEAKWAGVNDVVREGLGKLVEYLKANADEIKARRKANGLEGKY